jgi:Zn finger protein HypA/HybF involved in hydrogenase expression
MVDIKAELLAGTSPREVHERVEAAHRKRVEVAVAEGRYRCPRCRRPMKLKDQSCILYCGHCNGEKPSE